MRGFRLVVALLLAGLTAAVVVLGRDRGEAPPARVAELPTPSVSLPSVVPDALPVVWLSGRVAQTAPDRLTVVEPEGARIELVTLGSGATRVYVRDGGRWVEAAEGSVASAPAGTPVCVEALLDGPHYVAIRAFLGASCGPRG